MKNLDKLTTLLIALTMSTSLMAATYTVTSNTDTGSETTTEGKLSWAITQSNASTGVDDNIEFNLSSGSTVTISGALPTITDAVTINGNDDGTNVTVQVTTPGTSTFRVYNIDASGETVSISNMTIKGGEITLNAGDEKGGSVYIADGTLNLDNIHISDSDAKGGGGLAIASGAVVDLNNSLITSCIAAESNEYGGGGILNEGTLNILNTTISENGDELMQTSGIFNSSSGTLTLVNTTITGNISKSGTFTTTKGYALFSRDNTYMLNSIVTDNTATKDIYTDATIDSHYSWYGTFQGTMGGSNNHTTAYSSGDLGSLGYNGGYTNTTIVNQSAIERYQGFPVYGNVDALKAEDGIRTGTYDDSGTKYAYSTDGTTWTKLVGTGAPTVVTEVITDQRGYYRTSSATTRGAYQYDGVVAKNGSGTSWTGSSDVYSTIQAAYSAASSGNTIVIAGTVILESGITLNGTNLTFEGAGSTSTYVQAAQTPGSASDRVFNISDGTVTLKDMTVRYGNVTGHGGGITQTDGALTLDNVSVSNSAASGNGDGIYSTSPLTISNSVDLDNDLNSTGTLTLTNSSANLKLSTETNTTSGTFTANSGTVTYDGATQTINDLTYGALTISGSGTKTIVNDVTVNNDLTINSGTNLTIQSTSSGTGSLIINGTLSNSGTITSQRYFPGSTLFNWHMVSSPMDGMDISESNFIIDPATNYDFYAWYEPTPGTWVNYKVTSGDLFFSQSIVNNGDNFASGKGYLVAYNEANPTKTFTGNLNTGDKTFTLKCSGGKSWTWYAGWNLLGNPYSSAIDWNDAPNRTDKFEDNYAYIYDPNKNGGEGYVTVDGGSADAYIASNQGFFVRAKLAANNTSFTFNSAMQTHGGSYMKNQTNVERLVLRFSDGEHYDETEIKLNNLSSHNNDRNDAIKLYSFSSEIPQLLSYSLDEVPLAVNSIPEVTPEKNIKIGLRVPKDGLYTLSVIEASIYMMDHHVYLEDLLLNTLHKVSDSDYSFISDAGDIADRFIIHFGMVGIEDQPQTHSNIQTWASNNTIHLLNPENSRGEIRILNMFGQQVAQEKLTGNTNQDIQLNVPTGCYLVNVVSEEGVVTRKVIVN